jgi:Domain of unknown function (DUF4367)
MNEDFLTRCRKSPPREFSEALYKRINVQMNTNRTPIVRRLTFATALCLALIAALVFSPRARAAFNGLIVEIGGMFFLETDEAESQATPLPESQVTLVPEERLPLAEAQAKLPYLISLPTWVPDGFKMGTSVRIAHFPGAGPQVTITWYGSDPNVGNIDLTIFAQRVSWLVETDDVQEVEVNGQPAALVAGGWDYDTGQWDNGAARMLNWMKGNEMYQLHSPGAAVEDLIRMAESIP